MWPNLLNKSQLLKELLMENFSFLSSVMRAAIIDPSWNPVGKYTFKV